MPSLKRKAGTDPEEPTRQRPAPGAAENQRESEDSREEEEQEEEEFTVQRILAEKVENGTPKYLVRWLDYVSK